MKQSSSKRLDMLDGLRGVAILLVFLNHVNSKSITDIFPVIFQPIVETFFSSGVIGVSFLFILSGFLMVYIYPKPTDNLVFLQKRYTRIFPLFITMALVMTVFRLKPDLIPGLRILTILIFALISHFLWVGVMQKLNNVKVSKIIFLTFLFLQVVVSVWYLLVMRKPPIYLNQLLPAYLREGTITLVNITLTLPLGDYVPMLDGVYWSLAAEVLFYILYPTVCVPLVLKLTHYSRKVKILFLFSLIPFFAALSQLSKHILRLSMLFLPFFMYFAIGILLGYLLKNKGKTLFEVNSRFSFLTKPIWFFVIVILMRWSLISSTGVFNEYVRMLWTLPLIFLMIFILDERTKIARFFSSKSLVFLGTISYSIYLSHTAVVDSVHFMFKTTELWSSLVSIMFSFLITLFIATCLYYLLEKPYFVKRAKIIELKKNYSTIPFSILSLSMIVVFFLGIFIAYQSNFNFFSYEKSFDKKIIVSPIINKNSSRVSLREFPELNLRLKSPENNLGIITAHITYVFSPINKSFLTKIPQKLVFQIKEVEAGKWYATSTYNPVEIGNSKLHPFGFPVIENSKDKEYDVRLYLADRKLDQNIYLNINNGIVVKTVYQLDKKQFVKNPMKLLSLLFNRVENIYNNSEARSVFTSLLPFIVILLFVSTRKDYIHY